MGVAQAPPLGFVGCQPGPVLLEAMVSLSKWRDALQEVWCCRLVGVTDRGLGGLVAPGG